MEQIGDAALAFPTSAKYSTQPIPVDKMRQDQTQYTIR